MEGLLCKAWRGQKDYTAIIQLTSHYTMH